MPKKPRKPFTTGEPVWIAATIIDEQPHRKRVKVSFLQKTLSGWLVPTTAAVPPYVLKREKN